MKVIRAKLCKNVEGKENWGRVRLTVLLVQLMDWFSFFGLYFPFCSYVDTHA